MPRNGELAILTRSQVAEIDSLICVDGQTRRIKLSDGVDFIRWGSVNYGLALVSGSSLSVCSFIPFAPIANSFFIGGLIVGIPAIVSIGLNLLAAFFDGENPIRNYHKAIHNAGGRGWKYYEQVTVIKHPGFWRTINPIRFFRKTELFKGFQFDRKEGTYGVMTIRGSFYGTERHVETLLTDRALFNQTVKKRKALEK